MTFRLLLKEWRVAEGLTQAALADRLGRPQSYVSKYETGERRLDFAETAVICGALGRDIQQFAAAFCDRTQIERERRVSRRRD